MAKHAHRLLLNQKKTWRCTLPGCNYFIHLGLAHILPGKQSVCWNCGEEFTLDEAALEDEMPKCGNCRLKERGLPSGDDLSNYIETKLALARAGVKSTSELTQNQKDRIQNIKGVKLVDIKLDDINVTESVDQIESEDAHSPDCASWHGKECDCM